jgi:DNA-binding PadR family transcriptional regulator
MGTARRKGAQTLRHAILALMANDPASGYDIVQRIRKTQAFAWSAHHSQIYPELAKCLSEGLIAEVGSGPRNKRLYRTTPKGMRSVRKWLTSYEQSSVARDEIGMRSLVAWLLDSQETHEFYEAELKHQTRRLAELEELAARLPTSAPESGPVLAQRIAIERAIRLARAEMDWADWASRQSNSPKVSSRRTARRPAEPAVAPPAVANSKPARGAA